ncbi:MAG: hypothetical protein R3F61_33715 [Myxococcota bacterium]
MVLGLVTRQLGLEVLRDRVEVVEGQVGDLLPGGDGEPTRPHIIALATDEPTVEELGHVPRVSHIAPVLRVAAITLM